MPVLSPSFLNIKHTLYETKVESITNQMHDFLLISVGVYKAHEMQDGFSPQKKDTQDPISQD